ncbi:unnamed protein product [Caenorhabditis bovis]|uniref:Uncharacterized protein n=1 Tax=Caenorhabditis bovis TaxID=2654633 RepID=A0A8S1EEG1_9PELO|nr:unnamed protein product [Caenorhabditis bovis]
MDPNNRRHAGSKNEALHVDANTRGELIIEVSMSANRSHSNDNEYFAPSPGSSVGASVSLFSSRNSEIDMHDHEEGIITPMESSRIVMLHQCVEEMIRDNDIRTRYPQFYKFLQEEEPSWFEPSPHKGTIFRVSRKTAEPPEGPYLKKELRYEMLDLMYRFLRQKQINGAQKREMDELKEANRQLRITSVQIYAKAEQEEEFISNSLLKKIQKLKEDKEFLMKKYQKDEESLTSDLITNVTKIAECHRNDENVKEVKDPKDIVAEKEAEIERLQAQCRRAEKDYQAELLRLRAEKVDHEAALEQEQENLINKLGKRMAISNDEKRKMQAALEAAYMNGFIDFNEGVECAFRATAAERYGTLPSPSPTLRNGAPSPSLNPQSFVPQLNDAGVLYVDNQRLQGIVRQLTAKNEDLEKHQSELTNKVARLTMTIDLLKREARYMEANVNKRMNAFLSKIVNAADEAVTQVSSSTSPSSSTTVQQATSTTSSAIVHPMPAPQPPTALATVYPIQRSTGSRNDSNNTM